MARSRIEADMPPAWREDDLETVVVQALWRAREAGASRIGIPVVAYLALCRLRRRLREAIEDEGVSVTVRLTMPSSLPVARRVMVYPSEFARLGDPRAWPAA